MSIDLKDGVTITIGEASTLYNPLPDRVVLYNSQLYRAAGSVFGQTKASFFGDAGSKDPNFDTNKTNMTTNLLNQVGAPYIAPKTVGDRLTACYVYECEICKESFASIKGSS